jgi:trans-aconitate 2-methyltransferase
MPRQAEWNAETYHVVSRPHENWGAAVLARVPRSGITRAMDAGCGTGKITRALLELLPEASVTAVDYSQAMLDVARREYQPIYGDRVSFLQVDLSQAQASEFPDRYDLIFSTATFHWIHDHERLFGLLFDLLSTGGWLVAQCGGGPNLNRARAFASGLMQSERFARWFRDWQEPWYYADDVVTAERLRSSGFEAIETNLEEQPTEMHDAETYREYVRTVIFREHLAKIADDGQKQAFVDALVANASESDPPYVLDYWRLNMKAHKPGIGA